MRLGLDFELPQGTKVTALNAYNQSLYIADESGQIYLLKTSGPENEETPNETKWTVQETQKTKRDLAVSSLSLLPGEDRLIALTVGRNTVGYDLASLEPAVGFSMRDITKVVQQPQSPLIAVFTSSAIRFLETAPTGLKLSRTIEYRGIVTGLWTGDQMLLATSEAYELLDLRQESKIPLFPIAPGLPPLLAAVSQEEFVVVQGTAIDQPAMGLVINDQGEVARQGQVITWDSYPSDLWAIDSYILAIVDHKLVVNSLDSDGKPLDVVDDEPVQTVFIVEDPVAIVDSDLENKFNEKSATIVKTRIVLLFESGRAQYWAPPSPILRLESSILDGKCTEITPDMVDIGSEAGVIQLEYLSLLLALHMLDTGNQIDAVRAWLDGIRLDPNIVLYIFQASDQLPKDIPKGLVSLVEQLRGREKSQRDKQFFKTYLRTQIKRSTDINARKKLEQQYAKCLDKNALVEFISDKDTKSYEVLIANVRNQGDYELLEKIYTKRKMDSELLALWQQALVGDIPSMTSEQAAKNIANVLVDSSDEKLVWSKGIDLMAVNPDMGLRVFTDEHRKTHFDEKETLDALKNVDGDLAWRRYLKYLVYTLEMPLYVSDLATFVVNDLIDFVKHPDVAAAISNAHKTYSELGWPKRPFFPYLQSLKDSLPESAFKKFIDLELEFWALLKRPETDAGALVSILDEHTRQLYIVRCLAYSVLGMHVQAMEMLGTHLFDFTSLLHYCQYGQPCSPTGDESAEVVDESTRRDLAREAFRQIVNSKAAYKHDVMVDFLAQERAYLPFDFVVGNAPPDWPAKVFCDYVLFKTEAVANTRRTSYLERGLAKGQASNTAKTAKWLAALGEGANQD